MYVYIYMYTYKHILIKENSHIYIHMHNQKEIMHNAQIIKYIMRKSENEGISMNVLVNAN